MNIYNFIYKSISIYFYLQMNWFLYKLYLRNIFNSILLKKMIYTNFNRQKWLPLLSSKYYLRILFTKIIFNLILIKEIKFIFKKKSFFLGNFIKI